MIKEDVVLRIYFVGLLKNNQFDEFYYLFTSFCKENGVSSKVKVEYQHKDIWKNRSTQYSVKKESEIREKILAHDLVTLEISKFDDVPNPFHSIDLSFYFCLTQPITVSMSLPESDDSWGHIDFMINSNSWEAILNDSLIERMIREYVSIILKGNTRVVYGFVIKMPRENGPTFYAAGLNDVASNEDQRKEVTLFQRNDKSINKKIWQPFWGNIVTEKHLKSEVHKNEVLDLLGKENVMPVGEKVIFFKMPVSINQFEHNSGEHKKWKKRIHDIFAKYDAVLE